MLKCKINVRHWLWSVVESILVSNCHYSRLFGSIRTIRDCVLFDFSRHLFRPSRHSTQERGLLRSFLVREACTRHQTEAVWWRTSKDCWQLPLSRGSTTFTGRLHLRSWAQESCTWYQTETVWWKPFRDCGQLSFSGGYTTFSWRLQLCSRVQNGCSWN